MLAFLVLVIWLRNGYLTEVGLLTLSVQNAFRIENWLWFFRIHCNEYEVRLTSPNIILRTC